MKGVVHEPISRWSMKKVRKSGVRKVRESEKSAEGAATTANKTACGRCVAPRDLDAVNDYVEVRGLARVADSQSASRGVREPGVVHECKSELRQKPYRTDVIFYDVLN